MFYKSPDGAALEVLFPPVVKMMKMKNPPRMVESICLSNDAKKWLDDQLQHNADPTISQRKEWAALCGVDLIKINNRFRGARDRKLREAGGATNVQSPEQTVSRLTNSPSLPEACSPTQKIAATTKILFGEDFSDAIIHKLLGLYELFQDAPDLVIQSFAMPLGLSPDAVLKWWYFRRTLAQSVSPPPLSTPPSTSTSNLMAYAFKTSSAAVKREDTTEGGVDEEDMDYDEMEEDQLQDDSMDMDEGEEDIKQDLSSPEIPHHIPTPSSTLSPNPSSSNRGFSNEASPDMDQRLSYRASTFSSHILSPPPEMKLGPLFPTQPLRTSPTSGDVASPHVNQPSGQPDAPLTPEGCTRVGSSKPHTKPVRSCSSNVREPYGKRDVTPRSLSTSQLPHPLSSHKDRMGATRPVVSSQLLSGPLGEGPSPIRERTELPQQPSEVHPPTTQGPHSGHVIPPPSTNSDLVVTSTPSQHLSFLGRLRKIASTLPAKEPPISQDEGTDESKIIAHNFRIERLTEVLTQYRLMTENPKSSQLTSAT